MGVGFEPADTLRGNSSSKSCQCARVERLSTARFCSTAAYRHIHYYVHMYNIHRYIHRHKHTILSLSLAHKAAMQCLDILEHFKGPLVDSLYSGHHTKDLSIKDTFQGMKYTLSYSANAFFVPPNCGNLSIKDKNIAPYTHVH